MVAGVYTHIKRVHMEGFRSYKDQTSDDGVLAFSKHTNVIIGKNGSGKSNFFLAIKFVLSDAYSTLRAEDRRRLLHETDSAEGTTLSARVEIVFDNSDGRFPIDKDEVVLRRDIGFKKDEYYLDSHQVKKADVSNLLESAGFSRSNPYYIVQQGKVSALTVMKDSERLELLKEVAGTRVYDERKTESLKIIAETEDKTGKVDEMLDYINQRLDELSAEKDELKKYQDLDRKKRALEYAMYDTELHEAQDKLVKLDLERSEMSQNASVSHKMSMEKYAEIRRLEKEVKTLTAQLQTHRDERDLLDAEKQDLLRAKAKMDIDVGESRDKKKREADRVKELNDQLKAIDDSIDDRTKKLEAAKKKYQTAMNEENSVAQRIASHELRLTELYAKQGRSVVYKTIAERDKGLNSEIKEIEAEVKKHEEQVKDLKKHIDDSKREVQKKVQRIKEVTGTQSQLLGEIDKSQKGLLTTKEDRDKAANMRKDFWKQENDLLNQRTNLQEQLKKGEQQLSSSMPKMVSAGLLKVNSIVKNNRDKIRGKVYGPLIELFDVEPGYETCVEVAAGSSLFHIVVESDTTAADILEVMQTQKDAGRVSFIPLNITGQEPRIPINPNVESMMTRIKIPDNSLRRAFLHIFAKTAITRDLEVASAYAKENDINCVTMDGDQVNRKGAISGGYHDVRFSKIEAHKAMRVWISELQQVDQKLSDIKKKLAETENSVNARLGEMQTNEEKILSLRSRYEHNTHEIQNVGKDVELQQEFLDTKERALADTEVLLQRQRETIQARRAELGTPLQSQLSSAEQAELHKTNEELTGLKEEAVARSQTRSEAERLRNNLAQELTENFNKRRAEINAELANVAVSDEVLTLQQREADLATITTALDSANANITSLDDSIKQKTTELNGTKDLIGETKEHEMNANKELETQTKGMEKLLNKRSVLLQKREECTRKIRELGSLPTNALGEFKDHSLKELMADLKDVNVKLKDYSSVNKKALDHFSDQKVELTARKGELDKGRESIRDLIHSLDLRKDDAIERTFKGVAKNFNKIFEELIPNGSATLRISRDEEESSQASQSSQSSQPSQKSRVMRYNGISIRCSFTGKEENMLLQQLSGGQKSLVALVLIFAIQRADPAPFYLFDEVDAALDDQYRSAVAQMIKRQSENTQFIISTFHKPMAEIADQWYEVRLKHDISRLVSVKKQDAMKIIESEAKARASEQKVPAAADEEDDDAADGDVEMADE